MLKVQRLGLGLSITAAWLAIGVSTGHAEVMQTGTNIVLPRPMGAAEISLSENLGWKETTGIYKDFDGTTIYPNKTYKDFFPDFTNGDAVTLEGLFKWRKEKLDPVKDARTAPGYFSPTCGFTGELVLRGGDCDVSFGWYNVKDPKDPTPPDPAKIYPLIPSPIDTSMKCAGQDGKPSTTGFCPMGWDNHHPYNLTQLAWVPKAFESGPIATDPRYEGGYVAFALIGNPKAKCTQTKYSMLDHNIKNKDGKPWVTSLVYQSTVDSEGFYLMFEDLPMSSGDWTQAGSTPGGCDGDFNDFVFFVSGVGCSGGGRACTTTLQGACSLGRTDCAVGTEPPNCRPIIQPAPEVCDNVDNDCNGFVDDGAALCSDGKVCDKGSCVGTCTNGEFPCTGGLTCDKGACVDPTCVGIECQAGQACRGGKCVEPCDASVKCPAGQECQLGRCVDLCASIKCPNAKVCEKGLCVSMCQCRGCDEGMECGSDGLCTDPKCKNVTCPEGSVCKAGACEDLCANVVCPNGGKCVAGACTAGTPGGGVAGGSSTTGTITGTGTTPLFGTGSTTGTLTSTSSGTVQSTAGKEQGTGAGCGCRVESQSTSPGAALAALLGLGLVGARRRRRASRA